MLMVEVKSEYRFRRSILMSLVATTAFLFFVVIWGSLSDISQLLAFGLVLVTSFAVSRRVSGRYERILTDLTKFQQAVEGASDHIVITDTDGTILYANEGVRRITGFDPKKIIGKKAGSKELWGGQMPLSFYKQLWRRIKVEQKVFSGEVINKRENGEIYTAMASISPVLDQSGKLAYFVGIERDITQEKQVDRAKTEFVSLASHQLRTPLSAINWYSEMLMKGDAGKLSSKQRDFVEEICQGSHRMVALVSSLLNVSRLELGTFSVELSNVKLNDVIKEEIKELAPQIKDKKLKVSTKLAARLPALRADASLIRMVVQNLLSNAVKYTPEGGRISVKAVANKSGLHLEVADTGYGIPNNQQEKIFEKLFRADNVVSKDVEGTGLGLYIVKSIVDLARGKIWLESLVNKGTTFYVDLPFKGMTSKKGSKKLES